jgi:tRNA pseudouridine55 synthase
MPTSIDGLVLVDKPPGPTSFDLVRAVQRSLGATRAGHTGTLDPFASGLLVILCGRGTRLASFVPDEPKTYLATIAFGAETDTDDGTGESTTQAPLPDAARVRDAIVALTGIVSQIPPAYSAKQVNGRRAYALARKGAPLNLPPVAVEVHRWKVVSLEQESVVARITCGRGTYIRALARDLGRLAGSAAHLAALRRETAGPFDVRDAGTLDDVREQRLKVRPLSDALGDLPRITLTADDARRVSHGMSVAADGGEGARVALMHPDGHLLGLARRSEDVWHPDVVLASA